MMQTRAIRVISKIGYWDNATNCFKAMTILKLDDLLKIQICCLCKALFYNYDGQLKNIITT